MNVQYAVVDSVKLYSCLFKTQWNYRCP